MFPEVTHLILTATLSVCALMFILWLFEVKWNNASLVDIGWTLGLVLSSWIYFYQAPGYLLRKTLITVLVTLWGFRLSALLIGRLVKEKKEDTRYARIRAEWSSGVHTKFFFFFQFQALLDILLATPFLIISLNATPKIYPLEILGIVVWIIGLIGETLADEQLKQFKNDPANKGKICQNGLWNYSRHPNYFFEWLMWVGYFIFALASPWGAISIVCPIIMYYFLIYVSGVPLAEAQSLKTKGEAYKIYQETTSMFVPLPKKRAL